MVATLAILGVLLVLLVISVSRSTRRQRERNEEEQRRREQMTQNGGGGLAVRGHAVRRGSSTACCRARGHASRSLEYDQETGQWVEVGDTAPAASAARPSGKGESLPRPPGSSDAAFEPPNAEASPASSPFGGLFGG